MNGRQRFGIVMVAVLVLWAVYSASAFAAPISLLAEWLFNNGAIANEFTTERVGTILLEDTKTPLGASAVICTGVLAGTIDVDGLGTISDVLNVSSELIGAPLVGLALECVEENVCEESLVWPVAMPWSTLAELMEDGTEKFFVDLIAEGPSKNGEPGWEVECMKTILKPVDQCSGPEAVMQFSLENTLLLAGFSEAFTELAGIKLLTCSLGGAETGVIESIPSEVKSVVAGSLGVASEVNEEA